MQKYIAYHPESGAVFAHTGLTGPDYDQGVHEANAEDLPAGTVIEGVGLGRSTVYPSIDFETYSEAGYAIDKATGKVKGLGSQGRGGLPVVGTPVYAEHPSTEVLCLYYNLKDGKGVRGWFPGLAYPQDLLDYVASGGPIEAFNVTFEFWIWNMICARRMGWPPLQLEQCHCAMAKARRYSLPGNLGTLAKVTGTAKKDSDGTRLLNKLSRPQSATKKRPETRWTQATAWDDFLRLYSYCADDVTAEDQAAALIPDLTPEERQTWLVDQTINTRGVLVDMTALGAALRLMDEMQRVYTLELAQLTQGAVGSVSEVAKLQEWVTAQGLPIPNCQAGTVEETLGRFKKVDPPPHLADAVRALEIRAVLGGANIKKLSTLKRQVSSDGRLRDQYMYCGADRTGRFSAGGVQLQNITSKGPKSKTCNDCGRIVGLDCSAGMLEGCPACGGNQFTKNPDWTIDAVEYALEDIKRGDLAHVTEIWGDPAAVLAGCLRGMFVAAPGKRFICCDYSAIEAVVAACLARCQWRIDVFSTHGKIYEQSAANATGIPFDDILNYKKQHGTHHPARKGVGKIRELAGGYGGWIGAWRNFGADDYFDSEADIKADVLKWRDESPEIVEMWGGQFRQVGAKPWDAVPELYGLEGMAISAIMNPGTEYSYLDITYFFSDGVLYCRLPSGRCLHHHNARLTPSEDKLNRGPCVQILFDGYNTNNQKGPVGWITMDTYGGRLFENVVQAVSRDIQADAMKRCEARGYPVVMHTHDEIIAEVEYGRGSWQEMAAIMSERPAWAAWWPIKADGWEHERYQKD